jgi:diguanylate cyclase (GGDEF)-like protein/PAS domain S-box-containing protein
MAHRQDSPPSRGARPRESGAELARFSLALGAVDAGLWDWDPRTNALDFSPRWKSMLGYGPDEVGGRFEDWLGLLHPADLEGVREQFQSSLLEARDQFTLEYRIRHKDGAFRWARNRVVVAYDEARRPCRVAGAQSDITRLKTAEMALRRRESYDPLTGLASRALLLRQVQRALRHKARGRDPLFAVLLIDVDDFRRLCSAFRPGTADRLLVSVADRLRASLRGRDTLARVAADTFALLLDPVQDSSEAGRIADRIRLALREPFDVDHQRIDLTVSLGIALGDMAGALADELVGWAGEALFRARDQGGDQCVVHSRAIRERARLRQETERDLRQALERNEFVLHFQPIVSLAGGSLSGFEALMRWRHPERGMLLPADFISLAEEKGVIVPMGDWAIREACRFAASLGGSRPDRPLAVSVNLSPRQFVARDLVGKVEAAMGEFGIDGRRLRLEITEGVLIQDLESTADRLLKLKGLGVSIDVDDFGTGYSSLTYLRTLPIDALKVDREFVERVLTERKAAAIVRTVATLSQWLGIHCVAEGVTCSALADRVLDFGCDLGQGFHFGPAVTSSEARALSDQG